MRIDSLRMQGLKLTGDPTFQIWLSVAVVFATLVGPVLAVQTQKWLERDRDVKDRRMQIFRILMATRAASLSPGHVEALNAIPIEFYGPTNPKLKAITDNWQSYLDHLNNQHANADLWAEKRVELLTTLLHGMSNYLGLALSRSDIGRVYYPNGHGQIEADQTIIRQGFARLLSGEAIPMAVREFPVSDEAATAQLEVFKNLNEWLAGQKAVKVEQTSVGEEKQWLLGGQTSLNQIPMMRAGVSLKSK